MVLVVLEVLSQGAGVAVYPGRHLPLEGLIEERPDGFLTEVLHRVLPNRNHNRVIGGHQVEVEPLRLDELIVETGEMFPLARGWLALWEPGQLSEICDGDASIADLERDLRSVPGGDHLRQCLNLEHGRPGGRLLVSDTIANALSHVVGQELHPERLAHVTDFELDPRQPIANVEQHGAAAHRDRFADLAAFETEGNLLEPGRQVSLRNPAHESVAEPGLGFGELPGQRLKRFPGLHPCLDLAQERGGVLRFLGVPVTAEEIPQGDGPRSPEVFSSLFEERDDLLLRDLDLVTYSAPKGEEMGVAPELDPSLFEECRVRLPDLSEQLLLEHDLLRDLAIAGNE